MKTALVTGGTGGIGKEIAIGLARQGHEVIIVGRDIENGARAADELRSAHWPKREKPFLDRSRINERGLFSDPPRGSGASNLAYLSTINEERVSQYPVLAGLGIETLGFFDRP